MIVPKKSESDGKMRRQELENILASSLHEYEMFKTVERNQFMVRKELGGNRTFFETPSPHSHHSLQFSCFSSIFQFKGLYPSEAISFFLPISCLFAYNLMCANCRLE